MRNFTLYALLATATATSFAAAPAHRLSDIRSSREVTQNTDRARTRKAAAELTKGSKLHRSASLKHAKQPTEEQSKLIVNPEGETTVYTKSGTGYGINWMYIFTQPSEGSLTDIVKADGDKCYISNPVSTFPVSGYLEGTISGDEIIVSLPQLVEIEEYAYGDQTITYEDYAIAMEWRDNSEGGMFYATEEQTFSFRLNADGTVTPANPDICIGLGEWYDGDWSWLGYLEELTALTPFSAETAEAPADAEFSDWSFVAGKYGRLTPVAIKDDKVYVKNFFDSPWTEDVVAIGTIADGKVTFDSKQYQGINEEMRTTLYLIAGDVVVESDPLQGDYETFVESDALVFDYDAEKKEMRTEGCAAFSTNPDKLLYYSLVDKPVIRVPDPDATVASLFEPEIVIFYEEEYMDDGYYYPNELIFDIANVDPAGTLLDTDKLFYSLYIDGDLFEFYSDEYPGIEDGTTEVPYSFSDEGIAADGNRHDLIINVSGFDTLGLRAIYKDGDKTILSDIVTIDVSGIKTVGASRAEEVSTTFYDLCGREVRNPAKGIYVKATRLSDGSVKTAKTVVR